jgi:amino acid adenylation domain-containing protein
MSNTVNPLRGLARDPRLLARLRAGAADDAPAGGGAATAGQVSARPARAAPGWCATAGQEQIWFFDTMIPGTVVSNVALLVEVTGPLDLTALRRALTVLAARHEPLHTAFLAGDEHVEPVPAAQPAEPLRVHDLGAVVDGDRAQRELVDEAVRRPFDLAVGPLWRMVAIRRGDVSHLLVLVIHHIVSDGYSLLVFGRELVHAYRCLAAGHAPDFAPLPVTYHEFARWQREQLEGQEAAADLRYWQSTLRDLPHPVEWPYQREDGQLDGYDAETVEVSIDEPLSAAIRRFATAQRCSPYMVLLAGFAGLVHRVTGCADLVVGTPSAGRPPHVGDELIGYFANMLALRLRIGQNPTGRSLLETVREESLEGLAHQRTPFLDVVRAVAPPRRTGTHPIYQMIFTSPPPLPSETVGETGFRFIEGNSGQSLYDLEMQIPESDGARHGFLRYRSQLFDREQAQALVDAYLRLVTQLVDRPDRALSTYSLLAPEVRGRVVSEWNDTTRPYPADRSLSQLFEQRVDADPHAPALDYPGIRRSYGELDALSNQLARHLIARGVRAEDRVGICLRRSADWIVCALAVIKAGAAYVPLDPDYPPDSLAHMTRACGAKIVVAHRAVRDRLPETDVVVLDDAWNIIAAQPQTRPGIHAAPDALAYVMFTSGSTGRPKGVAVTHRNVVRLVRGTDYVSLRPGDTMAQASNISFDAATFEVWGALLNGGRLVGLTKPELLDTAALGARLRQAGVDTLFLTTSLAMQVARSAPQTLSGVRQLVFGGEQPDAYAIANLLAHDPPARIVNGYGPTETTTFAAAHTCAAPAAAGERIPIGRPIANTQIYVLDGAGAPVAPGVAGELCIGGDGVARGYWNEPELTAARFVPDHLSGRRGARLYRTGDLGRFRHDGAIEYLGRIDRQVKIRGFRVEPGEVEDCLHRSGLVRHAAVRPWRDPTGEMMLVGYLVLAEPGRGEQPVREHLRAMLPAHLVPAVLIAVDELPLTDNGKLDERALPPPRPAGAGGEQRPDTDTEAQVAAAWQELLGVADIGRYDNFFDLGGHSLRVTRAVARLATLRGVDIPLVTLYEHPTVAGFAAAVDQLCAAAAPAAEQAPEPGGDVGDLLDELLTLDDAGLARLVDTQHGDGDE